MPMHQLIAAPALGEPCLHQELLGQTDEYYTSITFHYLLTL